MVRYGLYIMQMREDLVARLNAYLAAEEDLAEARIRLRMQATAPTSPDDWLAQLRQQRQSLLRLRMGPHCDRLVITAGAADIRSIGSHGQQRLAAMALRLAEWMLRSEHRGVAPVLLLDDALESLDARRRARLFARLQDSGAQVFVTAPSVEKVPGYVHVHALSVLRRSERSCGKGRPAGIVHACA